MYKLKMSFNNFFIITFTISPSEKDDELLVENGTLTRDLIPLKQQQLHRKP